jgi:hypothetical protein
VDVGTRGAGIYELRTDSLKSRQIGPATGFIGIVAGSPAHAGVATGEEAAAVWALPTSFAPGSFSVYASLAHPGPKPPATPGVRRQAKRALLAVIR